MRVLGFYGALLTRLTLRLWRRRIARFGKVDLATLRRQRRQARELTAMTARAAKLANDTLRGREERQDNQAHIPSDTTFFVRPAAFRTALLDSMISQPETGVALGADIVVHHDMKTPLFSLRQMRNTPGATAPFGLCLEGWRLDGSYLSLELKLPSEEAPRFTKNELVRLSFDMTLNRPLDVYARLNLRYGPNVETLVRKLDFADAEPWVEFDVFYSDYEPHRGTDVWVDLLFPPPDMAVVTIRDLHVLRRPRVSL